MAWLLLSTLLLSVFTGISATTDILRPSHLALTAEAKTVEEAADKGHEYGDLQGPVKVDAESLGVKLTAPSSALIDTKTGKVLFAEGHDRIVPIASITKLMTAMVVLDTKPDWEALVTFVPADEEKEGIPYIGTGEKLTVRDTFYTALVGSANNAALALSRSTGLTQKQFAARMNLKARQLGLAHTWFSDPTGYDPENTSTALDVARLAFHALGHSEIQDAMTRTEYAFRSVAGVYHRIPATNQLLDSYLNEGEYQIIGGKTGYTDEAGYTLVIRASEEGGGDVIGVVLGSPTIDDRFQDLKSLLSWGFRTFEW